MEKRDHDYSLVLRVGRAALQQLRRSQLSKFKWDDKWGSVYLGVLRGKGVKKRCSFEILHPPSHGGRARDICQLAIV